MLYYFLFYINFISIMYFRYVLIWIFLGFLLNLYKFFYFKFINKKKIININLEFIKK